MPKQPHTQRSQGDLKRVRPHHNGKAPVNGAVHSPLGIIGEIDGEFLPPGIPEEPAATAIALSDSPEGEHLYQDIKAMEREAIINPDPEDALLQVSLPNEVGVGPLLPMRAEASGL